MGTSSTSAIILALIIILIITQIPRSTPLACLELSRCRRKSQLESVSFPLLYYVFKSKGIISCRQDDKDTILELRLAILVVVIDSRFIGKQCALFIRLEGEAASLSHEFRIVPVL